MASYFIVQFQQIRAHDIRYGFVTMDRKGFINVPIEQAG